MTVRALCTAALQRIGVIAAGDVPAAEEITTALARLNTLVDFWRTHRRFDYALVRTTWAIVPSVATYFVGADNDVDLQRPAHVQRIRFIDTTSDPDLELSLGEPLTEAQYQAIPQK